MRMTLLLLAAMLLASPAQAAPRWSEAFAALELGIARNYANFEQLIVDRRVDLPALAARTETALAGAADDAARRTVVEGFLRDLRDPHITIAWPAGGTGAAAAGEVPCPADGPRWGAGGGVRWDRLPGFTAVGGEDGTEFRAGVIAVGGERIGVLRLRIFLPRAFPAECAAAAAALGVAPDRACDDACAERVEGAAGARMNARLLALVDRLKAAGATRLVFDVSDNGGGSDWADSLGRALVGDYPAPRVLLLRYPGTAKRLADERGEVETALRGARGPWRAALLAARDRLMRAVPAAGAPCDLSPAWTDAAFGTARPLPCSNLVADAVFAGALVADAPAGSGLDRRPLYYPSIYGALPTGGVGLPLTIVVSDNTHSSAELFAAAIRDAGKAVLVGVTTAGAGCGHATGGGNTLRIAAIGAVVRLPDCVRLRRDGTSERRGIVPDMLVPWGPSDSAWQRATKALAAVSAARPPGY